MPGFISTPAAAAPYPGQVATLCRVPAVSFGGTSATTWCMTRSMHVAMDTIVNPVALFANWTITAATNVETLYPGGTIKAALEYPVGTFTLANECASGSIAKANGLTPLSFAVAIPAGATFWMRVLQQGPGSSVLITGVGPNQYPAGTGIRYGDGSSGQPVQDLTTGGTIIDSSGQLNQSYPPVAIVAPTRRPSFLLVGDSRTQGVNGAEKVTDASANVGVLSRLIGQRFAYINVGISGTQQANWNSVSRTYRDQLLLYISHVINNYGINDLTAGGSTPAQLAAARAAGAAVWQAAGKIVVGTTLSPNTSSTDNWATLAGQTPNPAVATFNDLVRAGIAGENRYVDVADLGDPLRYGKFAVSRDPLGSGGVAQFGTQDGLHESAAYNALVRDRGAGAVALLG